jgi:hypothetical protein
MTQYRVLAGIDYPPQKRAEVGDVVTDLPSAQIKNLLEIGAIELADGKSKSEVKVEETIVEETTPTDSEEE